MKKYLLLLLVSLFLYSCSKKNENGNIFRYNEAQGIENLDPVMCSNYPSIWPVTQVCEGLLEFNSDMQLEPLLTRSYKISDNGTVYTFNLRTDIYFQDDDCFPNKKGAKTNFTGF